MKTRIHLSMADKLKLGNWLLENKEAIGKMMIGEIHDRVRRTLRIELNSNSLTTFLRQLDVKYLTKKLKPAKTGKLQGPNDTPVLALALLSIMRAIDNNLDPGVQTKLRELINRDNPENDHEQEDPKVESSEGKQAPVHPRHDVSETSGEGKQVKEGKKGKADRKANGSNLGHPAAH